MKRILSVFFILSIVSSISATEVKIKITNKYLNFPISQKVDRKPIQMIVTNGEKCTSVIRLVEADKAEYWTFQDVSLWKGETITFSGDFSDEALGSIYQADEIAFESDLYKEAQRPIYHFTTRRGWINDPNGCIYFGGQYHMFYQHNPYEKEWENMHWAHAVSDDLIHWKELPLALHPDQNGTMFSGTAVALTEQQTQAFKETIGYKAPKKKGKKAKDVKEQNGFIAFFTADSKWETQCMAYSFDGGLTFTKYAGNPVVDSHERWESHDTRDPKVFWYAPGEHWVMVVNERNGNTIYNSTDLINWTPQSHIEGFWECPELFYLPVVGGKENEGSWVMWGASGTYMLGDFDGKTFVPTTPKLCNLNGSAYAAQTYANIPKEDGRVIKMAWGRVNFDNMPFNGFMLLPQEQTLYRTSQGLRLYSYPVKETEALFTKVDGATNLSASEANELLKKYAKDDALRIKISLHYAYTTDAGISYRGQRILNYDLNGNRLNGEFYAPDAPGSLDITADIYVDRSVAEIYADGGAFSYSMKLDGKADKGYELFGNQVQVKSIEIYKAKNIWE